jgi:hypothetical protein
MHLLLPLASLLGLEAEDLLDRIRQNAIAWAAVALLLLIAAAFLLVAANVALGDWLGPVLAPLMIAGVALLLALLIYLVLRLRRSLTRRRDAKRRHAAERTAMMTTAAITAVPMLIKSPLLRTIGIPIGGALAAAYFLARRKRDTDGDEH